MKKKLIVDSSSKTLFQVMISLFLANSLVSSFPARFAIEMGQPLLPIMLLVTYLLLSKKERVVAFSLTGIVLIKTFFASIFINLFKYQRKVLLKTSIILFAILLLVSPIIKVNYYTDFIKSRLLVNTVEYFPPANLDYYNQTIKATLFRFGIESTEFYYLLIVLVFLVLLLKEKNLVTTILIALIISPVSWQYYFVCLFPIFIDSFLKLFKLVFIKNKNRFVFNLASWMIFSFLAWWIEFPFLHQAEKNFITALLASHYLISAMVLLVVRKRVESLEEIVKN